MLYIIDAEENGVDIRVWIVVLLFVKLLLLLLSPLILYYIRCMGGCNPVRRKRETETEKERCPISSH